MDEHIDHQPHTFLGKRGETKIKGLRFKDLYIIICEQMEAATNPNTIPRSVCCAIEEKMGIFPNVPKARGES